MTRRVAAPKTEAEKMGKSVHWSKMPHVVFAPPEPGPIKPHSSARDLVFIFLGVLLCLILTGILALVAFNL